MKKNIEGSLAVVQLGITLVGVIAAATEGAGAEETFEPILLRGGVPESVSQILAIAIVVIPLEFLSRLVGLHEVATPSNRIAIRLLSAKQEMSWFKKPTYPPTKLRSNS